MLGKLPCALFGGLFCWAAPAAAEPAATQAVVTETTALAAYEQGFAYDVMRAPAGAGVQLNDLTLIEDDGPGAGNSDKRNCTEQIHQGVLAKKILMLDDPAAQEAHVVLLMYGRNPHPPQQQPYYLLVNGERIEGNPLAAHEGCWHWVKVPPAIFKKGVNEIVVGSAAAAGEGYELYFARADEYEGGGGKYAYLGNTALISADQIKVNPADPAFVPIRVGEHSAKSVDGGKTWITGTLGENNDVAGEYTIRLNLRRYKPAGRLQSPPIDLWGGLAGYALLKPRCTVSGLELEAAGQTPPGTELLWSVRCADTADMTSSQWGEFQALGTAAQAAFKPAQAGKRYLQWQVELKTGDPLKTPLVQAVKIRRQLAFTPPPADAFYVWQYENVEHVYRSFKFTHENPEHPKLKQLRDRLKLDDLLKDTRGDFEKINRLRHHISRIWSHGNPSAPTYPEWDALQILDNCAQRGSGGMCVQFSHVFFQALIALGYHAHHTTFGHEVVEVYIDELGKWAQVDAWSESDSYEFNARTGMPVNVLEQHECFLRGLGITAENPIDWMSGKPWEPNAVGAAFKNQPLGFSTFTPWINEPRTAIFYKGAAYFRFAPRNDYFSRPYPRPVAEGMSHWPWNGYLNWYDGATPRKLQYALHSDRPADFYPTMNRVQFSAVHGEKAGELLINMFTFAPYFDGFEVNVDDTGWQTSPARFTWKLRPSAVNTLQMRARNKLGPLGKPSGLQVVWHYQEPHKPKPPKTTSPS